jgi:hypothetical protein
MSAAQDASDAAWKPKANPWLIAVVVTIAAFMEILDTTIVNVSLPHIAGSVSASYDDATWTLTSYLVANGIVLPVSGFIGRVIGRKRYFMICIAGFVVCSFLCGTATSLGQIVIYRLFQGFFGGGLQPNQQSIILDTFEPKKRGSAFGVAGHRADAGRYPDRQLLLALDFLDQYPGRHLRALRGRRPGRGSALGEAPEGAHRRYRLDRAVPDRARHRLAAGLHGSRRG